MKVHSRWMLILTIGICMCFYGWTQHGQSPSKPSWEYKVISIGSKDMGVTIGPETRLNQMAAQGWELVLFQQEQGYGVGIGNYCFKRAK